MNSDSMRSKQILVVDDDPSIREMLAQALEDAGFRVAGAADGLEALDYLKTSDELPCLILLDLGMPIMDGVEFRMRQLEDARLSKVPVVLLTADRNNQIEKSKIGAVNVLNKPIKLTVLMDMIRRVKCQNSA